MIPLSMTVTIDILSDGNTYLDVLELSPNNYSAVMYKEDGVTEYEVKIYNHEGTFLELLEKILHGRNLS